MLGLGLGLHKNTFVGGVIDPNQLIIDAFKSRVLADGGTFEAKLCLINNLEILLINFSYTADSTLTTTDSTSITSDNY